MSKPEKRVDRYAIRKLTVGAASVLIGLGFINAGKAARVKADTINPNQQTSQESQTANQSQTNQSSRQAQVTQTIHASQNAAAQQSNLYESKQTLAQKAGQQATQTQPQANTRLYSTSAAEQKNTTSQANSDSQTVQNNLGTNGAVNNSQTKAIDNHYQYVDQATGKAIAPSSNQSVSYVPYYKAATGQVTYYDSTSKKELGTESIHGYVGAPVATEHQQLENYLKRGYQIDSDSTLSQRFTDGTNNYRINLSHRIESKNGQEIDAGQIVKFVDENGKELAPASQQTDAFIKAPDTTDLVTGLTTKGGSWNHNTISFNNVTPPAIDGYLATVSQIQGATVTRDNPISTNVIVYKKLGQMIPVIANPDISDINNPYIPISSLQDPSHVTIKPKTYEVDPNDGSKLLDMQTPPALDGYRPQNETVTVDDPFKDQNVVYVTDSSYHPTQSSAEATETINYVDENGNKIYAPTIQKHQFVQNNGNWTESSYTFTRVYAPIIKGYVADVAYITNAQVAPDNLNKNYKITYHKMGSIIPIDAATNQPIANAAVSYTNNPHDPTKAMSNITVPVIKGYVPEKSAVSPIDPTKDIRVLYKKGKADKITINFYDSEEGTQIGSKTLIGSEGQDAHYNADKDIQYYEDLGYALRDNEVPDDLTFTDTPLSYTIMFTHKTYSSDGDDSTIDGDPIDPSSPYGAKANISQWHRKWKATIHYTGAGSLTPPDNVQVSNWTRNYTIDPVTGQYKVLGQWYTDVTSYHGVATPVIPTYHADKAAVSDIDDEQQNFENTVTYKRNGRMILDFYDQNGKKIKTIQGPYWITSTADASQVLPDEKVPLYKNYIQTVREVTPDNPSDNEHIVYIREPDKIIVPVPVPTYGTTSYPTMNEVVSLAEQQIGKTISHPVVVATNKVINGGDTVYPYSAGEGASVGHNVRLNWVKMLEKASLYNNWQEGEKGKDFLQHEKGNPYDNSHTQGLKAFNRHDLSNQTDQNHGSGAADWDTDLGDNSGWVTHFNTGDMTDDVWKKVNHTNTLKNSAHFNDQNFGAEDSDNWEQIGLNAGPKDKYGNTILTDHGNIIHADPTPGIDNNDADNNNDETDVSPKNAQTSYDDGDFVPKAGQNNIAASKTEQSGNYQTFNVASAEKAYSNMQSAYRNIGYREMLLTVPVPAKKRQKTGLAPVLEALAAAPETASDNDDDDWQPTTYYAVVVDGKIVAKDLTQKQADQYVVTHKIETIPGYHLAGNPDNATTIDSPDTSNRIIYYVKDSSSSQTTTPGGQTTTPGQKTNPSSQTSNPSGQTTNPSGQTSNPSGQTSTPSGQTTTPSGQTTMPGQATNPSGQATTPGQSTTPGQTTTPGGQTTTPGQATTPGANLGTTPTQNASSPNGNGNNSQTINPGLPSGTPVISNPAVPTAPAVPQKSTVTIIAGETGNNGKQNKHAKGSRKARKNKYGYSGITNRRSYLNARKRQYRPQNDNTTYLSQSYARQNYKTGSNTALANSYNTLSNYANNAGHNNSYLNGQTGYINSANTPGYSYTAEPQNADYSANSNAYSQEYAAPAASSGVYWDPETESYKTKDENTGVSEVLGPDGKIHKVKDSNLPNTGQTNSLGLAALGCVLISLAAFAGTYKRKRS